MLIINNQIQLYLILIMFDSKDFFLNMKGNKQLRGVNNVNLI